MSSSCLQNLQQRFQTNIQSTQFLAILSPTSKVCRREMKFIQNIFANTASTNFKGYVVWTPTRPSDKPQVAYTQSTHCQDDRLAYYWDTHKTLSAIFATALGLATAHAASLYMIFAPYTTWPAEQIPQPTFWMHQLPTEDPEHYLQPETFNQAINLILSQMNSNESPAKA